MIKIAKNFDKIFIIILIAIFFKFNLSRISYGLPFFLNLDELAFQFSTLAPLEFITGYSSFGLNPIYGPLFNLILILKSVFINEFIINSLTFEEIQSKIYFNTELFIYYGRIASLITTSISLFFLYLIFNKLNINFFIYSVLLVSFSTSLGVLDVAIINGKNSYFLLIFLIQLFFFINYLKDLKKFNFRAYIVFGFLASIAWGINLWPAFISIYALFFLHYEKYKYTKIHYILIFLLIFIFFGPIINIIITNVSPFEFILTTEDKNLFQFNIFLKGFLDEVAQSLKIFYYGEKNIILFVIFAPIFLLNKKVYFKKEFSLIFFLIFEPIILFGISQEVIPQIRYFLGSFSIILILTAVIFNELSRVNSKFLILIIFFFNVGFIYNNILLNKKVNDHIATDHSFYLFNQEINVDKKKVLYLVDLGFQESLSQNLMYLNLYNNNIIKNNDKQKKFYKNIEKKVKKIRNLNDIFIDNKKLKTDIIYFNYSFFEIKNYDKFFELIKKDFDYVVIEESRPLYLSSELIRKKINKYVKENFLLEYKLYKDEKIYLRSLRSVINYYLNILNKYDFNNHDINHKLEKIYGNNYSLYKLI